jgi:hypothetical protein
VVCAQALPAASIWILIADTIVVFQLQDLLLMDFGDSG